jgi:MFS family permease
VSYRVRGIDLRLLAGVVLVQAAPIWLLAAPVPAPVLVAALAVSGLANGIVNPTIHSLFTLRPPPDVRPKVMTASLTASTVGAPAALLAAGPAFGAWGARPVYAVAAAAQTVAMLVVGSTALRFRGSESAERPRRV